MVPVPGMSEQQFTKAQRFEQRKEKMRILREEEAKRRKRTTLIIGIGGLVVLAASIFIVLKLVLDNKASDTDKAPDAAYSGDVGSYTGSSKPAELAHVGDDYAVVTNSAGEAVTNTDSQLPQISIYSNATCPHCAYLESQADPVLHEYMNSGKIQFSFYPIATDPVGCPAQSVWATAADYYIATYAPEQFFDFHSALMNNNDGVYARVPEKTQNGQHVKGYCAATDPMQPVDLADLAARVGVPEDIVNSLPASVNSLEWQNVAAQATEQFMADETVCSESDCGTPTVTLNGKMMDYLTIGFNGSSLDIDVFRSWLDSVVGAHAH